MESTDWDRVAEGRPGEEWLETTENGFGLMTAWAAGTANVRRTPVVDRERRVSYECRDVNGVVRTGSHPFTKADREVVDGEVESYLREAGIPLPPRGWSWLVRRPMGLEDDRQLWSHLNQQIALHASNAPRPAELAPILRRSMSTLYAAPR